MKQQVLSLEQKLKREKFSNELLEKNIKDKKFQDTLKSGELKVKQK